MLVHAVARDRGLSPSQLEAVLADVFKDARFDAKRILFVVPDATRSCPLPLLFRTIVAGLAPRGARLTFLAALGTHPVPPGEELWRWFGLSPAERAGAYRDVGIVAHDWQDPASFARVGTLSSRRIAELTGGLFSMDVPIAVNRLVLEHDLVVIVGPVFPHEVVGFSGGHKYLFPGIAEREFIDVFHWLGAIITNPRINGTRDTPVRRLVEEAAKLVGVPKYAICLVNKEQDVKAAFCGDVLEAWTAATEASAAIHIVTLPRPFASVLACAPPMYDDLWVAGKCMYKLEGVVADGGELIIYAPHVKEISYSHGKVLDEIGYHVRDYFLAQWERFRKYPWGVIAHSTHVRGVGTYEHGLERPRVRVTLATAIPEARCRKVALGYRDVRTIDVREWQGREGEGRLCVPHAGETLYRLAELPPWARADFPGAALPTERSFS